MISRVYWCESQRLVCGKSEKPGAMKNNLFGEVHSICAEASRSGQYQRRLLIRMREMIVRTERRPLHSRLMHTPYIPSYRMRIESADQRKWRKAQFRMGPIRRASLWPSPKAPTSPGAVVSVKEGCRPEQIAGPVVHLEGTSMRFPHFRIEILLAVIVTAEKKSVTRAGKELGISPFTVALH